MFKKFFAVTFAVVMLLSLAGCSAEKVKESDGRPKIVTTVFPAYDFARAVFGDTAEITLLLKPGAESHNYDPGAKDIVKINGCDLFIYNGGESDFWVNSMLQAADEVNTLRMMDAVELVPEQSEGIAEKDEHDHDDEEYDEHIWTSPKNAVQIIQNIEAEAERIFPENSGKYKRSADDYIEQINELDGKFHELFSGETRYFVFADRFPLLYFFREYGLKYYAAFPGCGSETEPSAQTVSFLADKLSGDDVVKTVFYIELSNHKLADTLAEENNLPIAEFHSCHNISADDFSAGETYLSIMERNYQTLKAAL